MPGTAKVFLQAPVMSLLMGTTRRLYEAQKRSLLRPLGRLRRTWKPLGVFYDDAGDNKEVPGGAGKVPGKAGDDDCVPGGTEEVTVDNRDNKSFLKVPGMTTMLLVVLVRCQIMPGTQRRFQEAPGRSSTCAASTKTGIYLFMCSLFVKESNFAVSGRKKSLPVFNVFLDVLLGQSVFVG
jgi:hypothetical protein